MPPIQFGVLCVPFQISDVSGPVDVLSSVSKPYLKEVQSTCGFSDQLIESGLDINFHYIAPSLEPITLTAGFKIAPTVTFADCPKLDYLLVGGPEPKFFMHLPEDYAKFMKEKAEEVETVFTTCTGGAVVAAAGLLNGKNATTNHQFVSVAQQFFPDVNWTKEKQWVVDGKFITAGGAFAGTDMMADWVTKKCGRNIAEAGFSLLDLEPRDIDAKPVPLQYSLRHGVAS